MTDIRELRLREADFLRRVRDVLCPLGGTIQPMTEEQKAALDMIGDRLIGFAHSETALTAETLLREVYDDLLTATETWHDSSAGPNTVAGEPRELQEIAPETWAKLRTHMESR